MIFIHRREISALEAENYSLERQLFSYQKSIAYAQTRAASYEGGSRRPSYVEDPRPNYPEESHPHSRRPSFVEDARANYSNDNHPHSRRPSYVEDPRAPYSDETHPAYPEDTHKYPEDPSRSPYPDNAQDPHGNYFLRLPSESTGGYQTPGYSGPVPTDFRPTTPIYQPENSRYGTGVFANGSRREYDGREYPAPATSKGPFEKREFGPPEKKPPEGARTDYTKPNYDYSAREYNYEEYERGYPGGTDYA